MKLLITSAILLLAISPLAQADHNRSYHNSSKHSHRDFNARVIDSTPIYKYVTVSRPQTICKPVVKTYRRSHDKGAAIFGGVVGGVIGHATSNNQHKGLGTLVGAVIGSSIALNIDRANINTPHSYQVKHQNCAATYNKARKVRVLDGYNVTYRAKGKMYQTFSQNKPDKYIRIYY